MSTRILPLLVLLPALAACTEVIAPTAETTEAAAPAVTQASAPAVRPAAPADRTAGPVPTALPPAVTPASTQAAPASRVPPLAPPPAAEEASAEAPAAAPQAPEAAPTGRLGTTVASLGTPTPGLWLETALVEAPTQGRIEYNGQTVAVELRPSGGEPGSGSQISLEAMRAIGAPLTGLPELAVYGG